MYLKDLYTPVTPLPKEETLSILDSLLYFLTYLGVPDLDISSGDKFKLDFKWSYLSWEEVIANHEYEPEVRKREIRSPEGTPEHQIELQQYNEVMRRLDEAAMNFQGYVQDEFIQWLLDHTLDPGDRDRLFEEGQCDINWSRSWGNYRVNVCFFDDGGHDVGLSFAVRQLRNKPFTVEQMEVSEKTLQKFQSGSGLILISWPTGSAKSSTLVAILSYINERKNLKIVSLEDPIEFYWKEHQKKCVFRQRQVDKTTWSFAKWIKAAMRQDPDVIIIWELRDRESVEMAIEAAGTWHLVISTVHVSSVVQVLDRVLWFFDGVERTSICNKLSSSLIFVLNQRLIYTRNKRYRVAYEWLDAQASWVPKLIKDNNLQDMSRKMYEQDNSGNQAHQPLNMSLFDMVFNWDISYSEGLEQFSNDQWKYETEFHTYFQTYCSTNWINPSELQLKVQTIENLYHQEKIEKNKNASS